MSNEAKIQTLSEKFDEATQKELNLVNSLPAMYSNRLYLGLLEDGIVRLTFCEEQRDTHVMVPRASLLLTDNTLLNLMGIIQQIIQHKNTLVEKNNIIDVEALKDDNKVN